MEENKVNSLVNVGVDKLAGKVYDNILSEPGSKISKSLATILDIGNTVLWPIKWVNERTRLYFENNLRKYKERLESVKEEDLIEVPSEISIPILDRFTYVSNEELSQAFINLLYTASSANTVQFAHPSFIHIIDRLSPDEAKIIKYFSTNHLCYINLGMFHISENNNKEQKKSTPMLDQSSWTSFGFYLNSLDEKVDLNFSNNISLYLDNLISLGILKTTTYFYKEVEDEIMELKSKYMIKFQSRFDEYPSEIRESAIKLESGMFVLTDYGELFIKACLQVDIKK